MLPPLNNDRDVRKYARENIGGRTEDMEKALDTLATNAPNSDVQDVANVGLMAMQGVDSGRETSEFARRHAGKSALEVLTDPDPMGSVQGVGRVGEALTDPNNSFALNLSGAETVLEAIQGASIPGAMGQAVAFTLHVGEHLKQAGQTATRHSAFVDGRADQMLGPGENYDFVGVSGVYHAAFSILMSMDGRPQVGDKMTCVELADLGNSMLLNTNQANSKYDGYLQAPDTPRTVVREVLDALPGTEKATADTQRWADLGKALLENNPQATGASVFLDSISQRKSADSVSMLAVGRKAMEQMPAEAREGFAQSLMAQTMQQRHAEAESPLKGGWEALDKLASQVASRELTAEQAVTNGVESLSQSTGDPWLEHGSTTPSNAGIGTNGQVVFVPGGRIKVRKPAAPAAEVPNQVVMERPGQLD